MITLLRAAGRCEPNYRRDALRFLYKHSILKGGGSFRNHHIPNGQRISIMIRVRAMSYIFINFTLIIFILGPYQRVNPASVLRLQGSAFFHLDILYRNVLNGSWYAYIGS